MSASERDEPLSLTELRDLVIAAKEARENSIASDAMYGHLSEKADRANVARIRAVTALHAVLTFDRILALLDTAAEVPQLTAQVEALVAEIGRHSEEGTRLRAAVTQLRAEQDAAVGLVAELFDEDDCRYDHHDCCQAHRLDPRPCPEERAKAFLAARTPPEGKR